MPSAEELTADPEVKPLIANDWTLIRTSDPTTSDAAIKIADRDPFPDSEHESKEPTLKLEQRNPFAWRGSLRAKTDADAGLAAAFSEYEKVIALVQAFRSEAKDDKLDRAAQDAVAVALFTDQSNWWAARQRLGRDLSLADVKPDDRNLSWYPIAVGQSVAMLAELRKTIGPEAFDRQMDVFGLQHADREFETAEFRSHFEKNAATEKSDTHDAKRSDVKALFRKWLDQGVTAKDHVAGCWSIYSFEPESELALIVYGGGVNTVANREIAERLQRAVARRFGNDFVPLKADREVTDADLKSHHLLVVGEPASNSVLLRASAKSAVKFGSQSFTVRDETFANPDSGVIVACANPWNDRFSVVIFAGLSPRATNRIADSLSPDEETSPQVVVFPANRPARRFVVR